MVIRDFKAYQPKEWRLLKFIGKTECFTWTKELEEKIVDHIDTHKISLNK